MRGGAELLRTPHGNGAAEPRLIVPCARRWCVVVWFSGGGWLVMRVVVVMMVVVEGGVVSA